MRLKESLFFLSIVFSVISINGVSYAQERIALIIGNSEYEHAAALPNPRNDAVAIGDALQAVGFDVTVSIDLDQREMQSALRDFGLKAETADVAMVYFAGHGIQVADQNYLLPVDAQLRRERDLIYEATPLSIVTAEVAQARQLGMVILDACRDNPLADNLRQSLGPVRSRMVGLGMARVEDVPTDTLIAFSTRFNQLAYDGAGSLSPFTSALVKHIQEPGLELNLFFRKVRDTVLDITANRQEPRTLDALGAKPFYFTAPKSNQPPELGETKPLVVEDGGGVVNVEIGRPTDADNDNLTIEVMGLPSFGDIEKADQEVVKFGDELTIEELESLIYRPSKGRLGEAGAFLFVVRDGEGGVTAGRIQIDVIRSNKVPVVASTQGIDWPDIPLGLEAPTDPDGDPLEIKILNVPSVGYIKNGDEILEIGDKLTVDEFAGLMLDPSTGLAGEFSFEVTDDHGGVSTSAINLALPGVAASNVPVVEQQAAAPASETETAILEPEVTPQALDGAEIEAQDETSFEDQLRDEFLETLTASNIRNAPGTSARWVAAVPAGARLKLIRKVEDDNWFQIETLDGIGGFISGSLVRPVETQPAEVPSNEVATPAPAVETESEQQTEVAAVDSTDLGSGEFVECEACPVMVELPGGRFQMGSDDGDRSERPVRDVVIEQPIAIGKYEVTQSQWQACASAGFCSQIADAEADDSQRPVQNVSWADAENFVAWLRSETEQAYRLPTEAEWEYAARGGTSTRFWWGDSFEDGRANCAECGNDWDRKRPSNVGSYESNPFGLYDMNGGVSEWVADCWIANYQDAPTNGAARSLSFCPQRVLRGGSWRSERDDISSSSRFRYDAQVRYYTNGLRVARDLN